MKDVTCWEILMANILWFSRNSKINGQESINLFSGSHKVELDRRRLHLLPFCERGIYELREINSFNMMVFDKDKKFISILSRVSLQYSKVCVIAIPLFFILFLALFFIP